MDDRFEFFFGDVDFFGDVGRRFDAERFIGLVQDHVAQALVWDDIVFFDVIAQIDEREASLGFVALETRIGEGTF